MPNIFFECGIRSTSSFISAEESSICRPEPLHSKKIAKRKFIVGLKVILSALCLLVVGYHAPLSSSSNKNELPIAQSTKSATPEPGTLRGNFQVNSNGNATYSIPIEVPPGIHGVKPHLSLNYNSGSHNGLLGVGWNIGGLSCITRCGQTYAADGVKSGITFTSNDRFCIDGQRLINVSGKYGDSETVYRTELETWRLVVSSTKVFGSAPESFTVYTKGGTVWTYGGTQNSQILTSNGKEIRVWALSSVVDLHGNTLVFEYSTTPKIIDNGSVSTLEDTGQYYPTKISYTSNQERKVVANRFVEFSYEKRIDIEKQYISGAKIETSARLASITTSLADGKPIKTYAIEYRYGTLTGRSQVTDIKQFGAGAEPRPSLPPTVFTSFDSQIRFTPHKNPSKTDSSSAWPGLKIMDANGDGLSDLVQCYSSQSQLHLATFTSNLSGLKKTGDTPIGQYDQKSSTFHSADINADGMLDMVVAWNSNGELILTHYISKGEIGFSEGVDTKTGFSWLEMEPIATDVNGDGAADILVIYQDGVSQTLALGSFLALPDKNGFADVITSKTTSGTTAVKYWPLDINGDGMVDLVQLWQDGQSNMVVTSFVVDSSGKFHQQEDFILTQANADTPFWPADVNGDGLTDIVSYWTDPNSNLSFTTYLAKGDGTFEKGLDSNVGAFQLTKNTWPMDVNADGKTDIVNLWIQRRATDTQMLTVFLATSAGQFRKGTDISLGTPLQAKTLSPADQNGDGRGDLFVIQLDSNGNEQILPLIATGDYPDLISTITNGIGGKVSIEYEPISNGEVYETSNRSAIEYPASSRQRYSSQLTPTLFPALRVVGRQQYVVSRFTRSNDPAINSSTYSYAYSMKYADAVIDLHGRGWQGFKTVSKLNESNGCRVVTTYNQTFPLVGTVNSIQHFVDGTSNSNKDKKVPEDPNVLLEESLTSYDPIVRATGVEGIKPKIYEVVRSSFQINHYDYGKNNWNYSLRKTYEYDEYGNQTKVADLGYVSIEGTDKSVEDNVYTYRTFENENNKTSWRLGYRTHKKISGNAKDEDITKFFAGDLILHSTSYDNNTRDVLSRAAWDNTAGKWFTSHFTYDQFGNRLVKTFPGGAQSTIEYESTYNTYVSKRISPPNLQGINLNSYHGYDPRFGRSVAIEDSNQNIFIRSLDPFGRVAQEQGPVPADYGKILSDPNALTELATGSADKVAQFKQAQVVTLRQRSWHVNDKGLIYQQHSDLQSWPRDQNRDTRYHRRFLDGLHRAYKIVSQGSKLSGDTNVDYTFDAQGKVLTKSFPYYLLQGKNPPDILRKTTSYDAYERPITHSIPLGANGEDLSDTTWEYIDGQDVELTLAAGSNVEFKKKLEHRYYNSKSRVQSMAVLNENESVTNFEYDLLGRTTAVTDPVTEFNPKGVTNRKAFDSLSRVIWQDNPDQNTTTDGKTKAHAYTYDPISGLRKTKTDASGHVTTFSHDKLGRVVEKKLWDGSIITYTFDDPKHSNSNGRQSRVTFVSADGSLQSQYDYEYDEYGLRKVVTLKMAGDPNSYVTSAKYDPLGRIRKYTFPDASKTTITRDYLAGNLTEIASDSTTYAKFSTYTANGRVKQVTYGNGVNTEYQYEPSGRLLSYTTKNGAGSSLLARAIQWNAMSNVTGIKDLSPSDSLNQSQMFVYSSGRLTNARSDGTYGKISYSYDNSGNILTKGNLKFTDYEAHRWTKMTVAGKQYTASYDQTGKTILKTSPTGSWSYKYNGLNRIQEVKKRGIVVTPQYVYDHTGRRISKIGDEGIITQYINGNFQITRYPGAQGGVNTTLAINSPSGTVATITSSVNAIQNSSCGYPTNGVLYYLTDHLGSTSITCNDQGQPQQHVSYFPFGSVYAKTDCANNFRPLFQGKEFDYSSQLYYFGARYYDSSTGRFNTPDSTLGGSLLQSDTFNRFAFTLNNPVNFTDPSGHSIWSAIGGFFIGAAETVAGIAVDVVSMGSLEAVGGALVGAGVNGMVYSATHTGNFSWTQYGIQEGVGAVLGAATAGIGELISAGAEIATTAGEAAVDATSEGIEMTAVNVGEDAVDESVGAATETADSASVAEDAGEAGEGDVDQCPAGSFVAGTLIRSEQGLIPIEEVKPGDKVIAWDESKNKSGIYTVQAVQSRVATAIVTIETDSAQIEVTPEHPFFVQGRKWVKAGELSAGDNLVGKDDKITKVLRVSHKFDRRVVYNFIVDSVHTYYVSIHEFLVHNPCRLIDQAGQTPNGNNYDVELQVPRNQYPESADHITDAQQGGHDEVLTIERNSRFNRRESLRGWSRRPGLDRDEYPPAMFEEGGAGADIEYINPADNRGSGSSFGGLLRRFPIGTRVWFRVVPF